MIFLSVGTERFPFDRLVQAADKIQERLAGEPVFIQLGQSQVLPKQCEWSRFLSFPEFRSRLSEARMVITHAGVGTILLCLQNGKIPIAVPRRKKLGEHVDDHQLEFAQRMAELGYVVLAESQDEIMELVQDYDKKSATLRAALKSESKLAETLPRYLTRLGN